MQHAVHHGQGRRSPRPEIAGRALSTTVDGHASPGFLVGPAHGRVLGQIVMPFSRSSSPESRPAFHGSPRARRHRTWRKHRVHQRGLAWSSVPRSPRCAVGCAARRPTVSDTVAVGTAKLRSAVKKWEIVVDRGCLTTCVAQSAPFRVLFGQRPEPPEIQHSEVARATRTSLCGTHRQCGGPLTGALDALTPEHKHPGRPSGGLDVEHGLPGGNDEEHRHDPPFGNHAVRPCPVGQLFAPIRRWAANVT